ncbi:MAG: peptide chain release factor N(5)-glutamine methyltransferase [Candidatus Omnitrophica bacterium]|nr:peptide chain release factor N(5)-glutamine methyltransferase [Candidatus Omnitrophota bacterium]
MNEAELLFSEVLNCNRTNLYLNHSQLLTKKQSESIAQALKRRIIGEPIQYILGWSEFMGFRFKVNKDCLIPRPETEILVEAALKYLNSCRKQETQNILDLCSGSGCIGISLAKLLPDCFVTVSDISEKALKIAQQNACLNGVSDKIRFIKSDLLKDKKLRDREYDCIVSNPPYCSPEEIKSFSKELYFEPRIALDGGKDGLEFYQRIIPAGEMILKKDGLLIMECGFNQGLSLQRIFGNSGFFEVIEALKDYNSLDRVLVLRRK